MSQEFAHTMIAAGRQVLVTTDHEDDMPFIFVQFETRMGRATVKLGYADEAGRDGFFNRLREDDPDAIKAVNEAAETFTARIDGELQ